MESAVAVHANGRAPGLYSSVKRRIFFLSWATEEKEPRRMAFRVMMSNQISTWLSQDEYVGVRGHVGVDVLVRGDCLPYRIELPPPAAAACSSTKPRASSRPEMPSRPSHSAATFE